MGSWVLVRAGMGCHKVVKMFALHFLSHFTRSSLLARFCALT
jgi:hypothetical protein